MGFVWFWYKPYVLKLFSVFEFLSSIDVYAAILRTDGWSTSISIPHEKDLKIVKSEHIKWRYYIVKFHLFKNFGLVNSEILTRRGEYIYCVSWIIFNWIRILHIYILNKYECHTIINAHKIVCDDADVLYEMSEKINAPTSNPPVVSRTNKTKITFLFLSNPWQYHKIVPAYASQLPW